MSPITVLREGNTAVSIAFDQIVFFRSQNNEIQVTFLRNGREENVSVHQNESPWIY